jgi:IstB-like ATP binding protein
MTDLQHQRLADLCRELRLSAVADLYSAVAQDVAAKEASFADFLEAILRAERDARRARAREMFARVAGFPAVKTLDGSTSASRLARRASRFTSSPAWPSSSAPRTSSSSALLASARRTWQSRLVTSPLRTATRCASPRRLIW